jgi:CRISPR-associated endonuclease Csy4
VKSSIERIRRRQMHRHGWSEEEALRRLPDREPLALGLPFLNVASGSTGQRFKLFIAQAKVETPASGVFNAYGLSGSATVPWV